jgi:TATA-box binding protein (TBP) (component of TFIID and TFIIIB)
MTVTADWGMPIQLDVLFEQLKPHFIPIGYPDSGILKFEQKKQVLGACHKDLFTNRKITKKPFYNQNTIILRRPFESGFKEVNMKLFDSGGIQMTGVKSKEFAVEAVAWLLELIKTLPVSPFRSVDPVTNSVTSVAVASVASVASVAKATTEATTEATTATTTAATEATESKSKAKAKPKPSTNTSPSITKVDISLINTDYSLDCDIQQDNLHRLLIERYNLFSMLEKTIYQGVNAKYFYNTNNHSTGVCACGLPTFCKGQGTGDGKGECKRITMSIFRTGKIIITGARTMDQIEEAYRFLNRVFDAHKDTVLIKR